MSKQKASELARRVMCAYRNYHPDQETREMYHDYAMMTKAFANAIQHAQAEAYKAGYKKAVDDCVAVCDERADNFKNIGTLEGNILYGSARGLADLIKALKTNENKGG